MKAILRTKPGKNFSSMQVLEIEKPIPSAQQVKVKMVSSRINPVDMDLMKGFPSLKYKTPQIGGIDGAGVILEVGSHVMRFKPGDKVFFYRKFSDIGTWAEEICVHQSDIAKIPDNISVEEAGSLSLPLLTAFESLQRLQPKPGERILLHGAGGGVGYIAVHLAKQLGLKVVAHASERDRQKLEKAGIDRFIDYKSQDFYQELRSTKIEYVFDIMGGETLSKSIQLRPLKVVSIKYVAIDQMHKAGVALPGILKWIMRMMMWKFDKLARKHGVELIGQVTGANGLLLQQAAEKIQQLPSFSPNPYQTLSLQQIATQGLNPGDVGKVIVF